METFLVGGAVRDQLLGLPIKDRDWVVVGTDPQTMIASGYQAVGRDFPVFLHPQTHEEYALARTERKRGHGYHGFETDASPNVSLEEDLIRRDLTINAMAVDENGKLIDPYGGQSDLNERLLRHVSTAFSEDPLRVLRTARFAARYHHLGFRIAPETLKLMRQISISHELQHISAERIWAETARALMEQTPSIFFESLHQCKALNILFPELAALVGVPQTPRYHREIDTWLHTRLALDYSASCQHDAEIRFAVLVHDLGKALTPSSVWPRHIQHESAGIKPLRNLCTRLKIPKRFYELSHIACKYHLLSHQVLQLRAKTILKLFEQSDAFRRPERFLKFLQVCYCDAMGRKMDSFGPYVSVEYLQDLLSKVRQLNIKKILSEKDTKEDIVETIRYERLATIQDYIENYRNTN